MSVLEFSILGQARIGLGLLQLLLLFGSIFLILLVLVQRGKGGGLTGALGGMGGQSAFGAKAGDAFTKVTVVTTLIWITLCMVTIALFNRPPPKPDTVSKSLIDIARDLENGVTPEQSDLENGGRASSLSPTDDPDNPEGVPGGVNAEESEEMGADTSENAAVDGVAAAVETESEASDSAPGGGDIEMTAPAGGGSSAVQTPSTETPSTETSADPIAMPDLDAPATDAPATELSSPEITLDDAVEDAVDAVEDAADEVDE